MQERAKALEHLKLARIEAAALEREAVRAQHSNATRVGGGGGAPRFGESAKQPAVHKGRMEAALEARNGMQASERERALEEAAARRERLAHEKTLKAAEVEKRRIELANSRREKLDAFAQRRHEQAVEELEAKLKAIEEIDHVRVIENSQAHDEKKKKALAVKARAEALEQLRREMEYERINRPRPDPTLPLREAAEARRVEREAREERVRARQQRHAVLEERQRERYEQQYEEALAIGEVAAAFHKRGAI